MMDVLFLFIRSLKIGDWEGHLEATYLMIPWMFSHDRPNYSRSISLFWVEMRKLPETYPSIYQKFMSGNFCVKRTAGTFNSIPSDQAIEQTINWEQKCRGGITGFCTSEGIVQRWVFTSHTMSQCLKKLENDLATNSETNIPKDLGKSRKEFDNTNVKKIYQVLENWGNPFAKNDCLVNICSGVQATDEVTHDIINV